MRLNFSGKMYEAHAYELNPETFLIDMDIVRQRAHEVKPAVLIAGWSAYSRHLDFAEFRKIADEVGAKLWVDMAHFAGLVAAGLHPSPVPYADVISTTVHKTLAGPRSGLILCKEEYAKKIDSAVFPGQQRTLDGARLIAERLTQPDVAGNGVSVLTGGTEVHLVLVDLRNAPIDGKTAEDLLHEVGITVNRNSVPNDPRPPLVTSGVRIGTPALATRGFAAEEFTEVADIIAGVLLPNPDIAALKARVAKLTEAFPLYPNLENW
jgi:glycine hydroxymethyltransferase